MNERMRHWPSDAYGRWALVYLASMIIVLVVFGIFVYLAHQGAGQ